MIVIKFNAKYEDRVSIYLSHSQLRCKGIDIDYIEETPNKCDEKLAYWKFSDYRLNQINIILNALKDLKDTMGVDDLCFSFAYNEKELYTQFSNDFNAFI